MPQDGRGYIHVDENMRPLGEGVTAKRTITEETLWEAQAAEGGIFRRAAERLKLTNLRAIRGGQSVMLKDCDSIMAANVRTESGRTVGDVQFIMRGSPAIVFPGVSDPDGLAALAGTCRENVLLIIRQAEEEHAAEGTACPHCKKENQQGSKFCGGCGRPL